jgi:signal transduction histidine kinase
MTKIDNQALQIFSEDLKIGRLINQCVGELKPALAERKIALQVDEKIKDLPSIWGDEEVLLVVFANILTNAIKYTPDGGRIQVDCNHWQDQPRNMDLPQRAVEVIIRDNGIGINPESLDLIFTKFYQTGEVDYHSSGRTKFKGGGPGLGLAIARGVIEAHNGRLWAESQGKDEVNCPGSSFHIVLPVNRPKSN